MKKLAFLLITILGIYLIYVYFDKSSINYVSISDNVMVNGINYNDYLFDYLKEKKRIDEYNPYFINYKASLIYQDIKNNRTIRVNNKDYYIKKSLRESDIVIISVGMEELSNNFHKYDMDNNYTFFNKMYLDIEKLVLEVKKYAQDKIIFLGLYNPSNYYDGKVDEFFYYINNKLNRLMLNNSITYISLYELVKGNDYNNSVYLNNAGHFKLSKLLNVYL